MLRAAFAFALLLLGSAVASAAPAPITEIGLAECYDYFGHPLDALRLTPDGRVLRWTALLMPDGKVGPAKVESADIGVGTYRAIAHQIETSTFFERSHTRGAVIVSDTHDDRISAVRAGRRMTWAGDRYPKDRGDMIWSMILAVHDPTRDVNLVWHPATTTIDQFALCREPVQEGEPELLR